MKKAVKSMVIIFVNRLVLRKKDLLFFACHNQIQRKYKYYKLPVRSAASAIKNVL